MRELISLLQAQLEEIKNLGAEIILSIFGESEDEFKKIALKIKPVLKHLKAVELNYSCPNVKAGGMAFCAAPENIRTITSEIKSIIDIPLIAKLSPNFGAVTACAIQAKNGGADAVSVINTITGTAFDINTYKPRLANIVGGLSGPAIKPAALLQVYQLAKEKIIPVIGMGGIYSWQDAVEFLIAGASSHRDRHS